jgi:hypothetical protein
MLGHSRNFDPRINEKKNHKSTPERTARRHDLEPIEYRDVIALVNRFPDDIYGGRIKSAMPILQFLGCLRFLGFRFYNDAQGRLTDALKRATGHSVSIRTLRDYLRMFEGKYTHVTRRRDGKFVRIELLPAIDRLFTYMDSRGNHYLERRDSGCNQLSHTSLQRQFLPTDLLQDRKEEKNNEITREPISNIEMTTHNDDSHDNQPSKKIIQEVKNETKKSTNSKLLKLKKDILAIIRILLTANWNKQTKKRYAHAKHMLYGSPRCHQGVIDWEYITDRWSGMTDTERLAIVRKMVLPHLSSNYSQWNIEPQSNDSQTNTNTLAELEHTLIANVPSLAEKPSEPPTRPPITDTTIQVLQALWAHDPALAKEQAAKYGVPIEMLWTRRNE